MNKGKLIVFSAPSGCGKGTMLSKILEDKQFYCSISVTTRAPRDGEVNGVNYYFITRDEFKQRIENNGMLEYAEYCNNYYGTPLKEVNEQLNSGKDVILEIEVKGAMKIREICPEAIFIFVVPTSLAELERRLHKRGTETDDIIKKRVSAAAEEIPYASKYDYVIVNDVLEVAVNDFKTVIKAERLKAKYADELLDEVMKNA